MPFFDFFNMKIKTIPISSKGLWKGIWDLKIELEHKTLEDTICYMYYELRRLQNEYK